MWLPYSVVAAWCTWEEETGTGWYKMGSGVLSLLLAHSYLCRPRKGQAKQ